MGTLKPSIEYASLPFAPFAPLRSPLLPSLPSLPSLPFAPFAPLRSLRSPSLPSLPLLPFAPFAPLCYLTPCLHTEVVHGEWRGAKGAKGSEGSEGSEGERRERTSPPGETFTTWYLLLRLENLTFYFSDLKTALWGCINTEHEVFSLLSRWSYLQIALEQKQRSRTTLLAKHCSSYLTKRLFSSN